jgi:hypothetical protein
MRFLVPAFCLSGVKGAMIVKRSVAGVKHMLRRCKGQIQIG